MKDHRCTLVNINIKGYDKYFFCPVLQYNMGYETCENCNKEFISEMQEMINKEQEYKNHITALYDDMEKGIESDLKKAYSEACKAMVKARNAYEDERREYNNVIYALIDNAEDERDEYHKEIQKKMNIDF